MVSERHTCRQCGSLLGTILNLGDQCVVDFPKIGESSERPRAPLELAACVGCNLVQLRHTVAPEFLYPTFWYRSGINPMMRAALANVVEESVKRVSLESGDAVLDIGCNDGTMLGLYKDYTHKSLLKVGIDPAANVVELAKQHADEVICDYFSENAVRDFGPYKLITAIAMFYDLEDPHKFLRDICGVLHPDGLFVIQMNALKSMMELNAVDNICHEHLEYYSLGTLETALAPHGLRVIDVEENDVNGGSLRVYIKFSGAVLDMVERSGKAAAGIQRVANMRYRENQLGVNDRLGLEVFGHRIEAILHAIRKAALDCPKPLYLYGASTRGTTLMQALNLPAGLVTAAAERDERKYGREMVGTGIPIISEEEARRDAKTFLCLPWHFWPAIAEREREWIDGGGIFIKPLPEPAIITKDATIPLA